MSTEATHDEVVRGVYVCLSALINDLPREEFVSLMAEGIPEDDLGRALGISMSLNKSLLGIIAEQDDSTIHEIWQSYLLAREGAQVEPD